MGHARPLPAAALTRTCSPSSLGFRTTADLPDSDAIVGQDRATDAIDLAVGISGPGFNIYALGPHGIGKMTALRQTLQRQAARDPVPDDWVYVHDVEEPQRPRALRLPPGRAGELGSAMTQLCAEVQVALVAAFEGDTYRARRQALEGETEALRDAALATLEARGRAAGVAVMRTQVGLAVAPLKDGKPLDPDAFRALPEDEQQRLRVEMERLGDEVQDFLRQLPIAARELHRRIRDLDREVTSTAVRHLTDELRVRFADLPEVIRQVDAMEADIVERGPELRAFAVAADGGPTPSSSGGAGIAAAMGSAPDPYRRYRVNVLVDSGRLHGAPFVVEDLPTVANLVGRVEHSAQLGTLVTDFTLVRAGALHRANGGYLVLEAEKLLAQPYAWDALKRALRGREIRIESVGQTLGLLTGATLEPQPIPLAVKVALTGDRRLYHLLCARDPEFLELFKVAADFSDEVPRTPTTIAAYAGLMATLGRREGLRPLAADAVARSVEQLGRMVADQERLSTDMGRLMDLLREADHLAGQAGRDTVIGADVRAAIDARRHRSGRIPEAMRDQLTRHIVRVETSGEVVGQVNALSVLQLGDSAFGQPSRVTASVRIGRGEVVDIEREVELGGPLHSKGVLILTGFLGGRFGGPGHPGAPLALTASLVFEQSYGGVEGDSASLAELCALLSAIGGLPIRQDLALTGSVDQRGQVQAIGGVNEKIEGFFDACSARGLTGTQGVLIPAANVPNLMLHERVVAAVRARTFRVWPVDTVDQAMELLTGLAAGVRGDDGRHPARSVNGRVERGLVGLAEAARLHGGGPATGSPGR